MYIPTLEILEARIAPALFFVSGATGANALKVFKVDGSSAQDTPAENDAAALTHATAVVSLAAGDLLIFDRDGDHAYGPKDSVLMQVSQGSAMVFLTDVGGKRPGAFDPNEIGGIAVADGFRGSVFSDVNGPVVTALDGAGDFTGSSSALPLLRSDLANLRVTGQIAGHVLTGGSLAGLSAGASLFTKNAVKLSVTGGLATSGAAAGIEVSFDGGTTKFTTAYTTGAGEDAGSIANVALTGGTPFVRTGVGGAVVDGAAGAGGDIVNVRLGKVSVAMEIRAGNGGAVTNIGTGGHGGNIIAVSTQAGPAIAGDVTVTAGYGGLAIQGTGGDGGKVANSTFVFGRLNHLYFRAGDAGFVTGLGSGGRGGDFVNVTVEFAGSNSSRNSVNLVAGNGGDAGNAGGSGGDGGTIERLRISIVGKPSAADVDVLAGGGGSSSDVGGFGGRGGSLIDTDYRQAAAIGSVSFTAGYGGYTDQAAAGQGGAISGFQATLAGGANDGFILTGGRGGDSTAAMGGASGVVDGVFIEVKGKGTGDISVNTSLGGTSAGATGTGAASGSITNVRVDNFGRMGNLAILGANGGDFTGTGLGAGGRAGDVTDVVINNHGKRGTVSVSPGSGGILSVDGPTGATGDGGNVSRVTFNDYFGGQDPVAIYSGFAKLNENFTNGTTKGGYGGSVTDIELNALKAKVHIISGQGSNAGTDPGATGGDGGNISNVSGVVGELTIAAGKGGNAPGLTNSTGGTGGDVSGIHLGKVKKFVRTISAGDGGAGLTPGAGGSIFDVSVAGDIGDFKSTFGVNQVEQNAGPKMGGLVAGGSADPALNGSIIGVSARRIAAILAGQPDVGSIGYGNAVTRLDGIFASVIGADTHILSPDFEEGPGSSTFDFIEGGTDGLFQPDGAAGLLDGDKPIDGFVLVKAGGLGYLSATPLKLVTVT